MDQPIPAELGTSEPTPLRPVRHHGRSGTSLPVLLSSFVGREREIAAVVALLSDPAVRLVTLTGPGGVGKTRLAIEAATRLSGTFPDDVCFAPLAAQSDPAQVLPLVARSLGVRPVADHLLMAQLSSVFGAERALMLLDNLEHVLDAAPALAELLAVCPGLTILATSREPLHLSGEHEFLVPALRLPEPGDTADPAILAETEAVNLFVQRARQIQRDFALTADNAPAVAELCARLDGLPLGIELAAARAKLFPPRALLARLDRRLDLLTSGPSDALPRLRSLRGAVAWSHDLLDANEQRLFRRLAVFAGGFSLDAAEVVAQGGPDEEPISILDGMASLVDQSLVRADVSDRGETRFAMLETVRAYALEQLEASGDAAAVRDRHARWCLAMAEQFWERDEDIFRCSVRWSPETEAEQDNVWAALAWLDSTGDAEGILRLAVAFEQIWAAFGYRAEAVTWLERGLTRGEAIPPYIHLRALAGLGRHLERQGFYDRAQAVKEEQLALARTLGDDEAESSALHDLAVVALNQGRYDEAACLLDESKALHRHRHGSVAANQGGYLEGIIAYGRGNTDEALDLLMVGQDYRRELGHPMGIAVGLNAVALLQCECGEAALAAASLAEALPLLEQVGNLEGLAEWMAAVARLAARRGQVVHAATLYGAAEVLVEASGAPLVVPPKHLYARHVAEVRRALGQQAFATARDNGRAQSRNQAIANARGLLSPVVSDQSDPGGMRSSAVRLTPHQREILTLVAGGRTDAQIAAELFISARTVEEHVRNIRTKLGAPNRAAAVNIAQQHGLI